MLEEKIIPLLQKVRKHGKSYMACCPSHDDKNPSLSLTELSDGRILMKCFAGCDVYSILSALNLSPSDLFPDTKVNGQYKQYRSLERSSRSQNKLNAIEHEQRILDIAKNMRAQGKRLSENDLQRELVAFERIRNAQNH